MVREKDIEPGRRGYLSIAKGPDCCPSFSKVSNWKCTREPGHKGKHAAHGLDDMQYATWDNTDCKIATAGKRRTRR